MKKLFLCALFSFLLIACATTNEKTSNKQIDGNENATVLKVFEQCAEKYKGDDCDDCLFIEHSCFIETLYNNCTQSKDKDSCEEIIKVLPSVKECGKEVSCNDIGVIYKYAEKFEQEAKYYEKACNNFNSGTGCANLGNLYALGEGVKQNFFKAVKFYQKSCDLNYGMGCSYLSDSYRNGRGVKQSISMAIKYSKKACNLDDARACYNLGAFYVNGLGVRQDLSTAKKFCGKSCDLGDQMGCDCYKTLNEQGVK